MKILLVHNEYRELGGEEKVVEAERRLLQESGVEVEEIRFRSAELEGLVSKLRTAWELPHSQKAKHRVAEAVARFRPDVMHVHNFFPLATPSIFEAAKDAGVATVMTLHNYRIICANGLLLRDGRPCELCVANGPGPAVRYRCYQGSLLGSAAMARMISVHRRRHTWHDLVDRFIVLTKFAQSRYEAAGLPAEKFVIKPNFLFDPGGVVPPPASKTPAFLFVGRLSPEKGLETLLRARALGGEYELHIVGDGPLAGLVESASKRDPGIHWHGRQESADVYRLMRGSSLVVFPSECYENFPIVVLEAMAHARATICGNIGGLPEIVEEGKSGFFFRPGDAHDLADKLKGLAAHSELLRTVGVEAREVYSARYRPEPNLARLREIYLEAMAVKA